MTTRLDIALEALRIIARDSFPAREYSAHGCDCGGMAGRFLTAIAAAPPEIVLTREEAELCVRALEDLVGFVAIERDIHDGCPNAALSRRLKLALNAAEGETK